MFRKPTELKQPKQTDKQGDKMKSEPTKAVAAEAYDKACDEAADAYDKARAKVAKARKARKA